MSTIKNEFQVETFDLPQAANFLHMSTSALRLKIKSGEIKAAKLAKKWVFLRQDLVEFIRSKYTDSVEMPSSDSHMEKLLCHYSDGTKSGGSDLQHQMDDEYAVLLGLKTKP